MKPFHWQFGTIDNTGGIQPDFLPLPDGAILDPDSGQPGSLAHGERGGPASSLPGAGHAGSPARGADMAPGSAPAADVGASADTTEPSPLVAASAALTASVPSDGATPSPQTAPPDVATQSARLVTYAPLVITPEFGASITTLTGTGTDPTTAVEVEAAIDAAIDYYETHWTSDVPIGTVVNGATVDTVSIAIEFGYGTLAGQAMTNRSGASQSMYRLVPVGDGSFAALHAALSGELPDLPTTDPTGGGSFYVTQAQSQLLGLGNAATGPVGYVGLNAINNGVTLDWNLANQSVKGEVGAVGAIEHEISEVLGRTADLGLDGTNTYTVFDLYRFKAANTPALQAGPADYFSLNNGTTALGYFNNHSLNGGDAGDWAVAGPRKVRADALDAFLFPGVAGTISNLDSLVLGAIGLHPAPRTLLWTGAAGSGFAVAANWNDLTDGRTPAQIAPSGTDVARFPTGGGTVTGSGTVAALQFGGTAPWEVTAAASLSAATAVTVGQSGSGTVLVTGGAGIAGLGAADSITGTRGGTASVTVDGIGSRWQSDGKLTIGDRGAGSLTVSHGASLGAAATALLPAMVLGATSRSTGSLTVTDPGSRAMLVGQIDVGQAGTGTVTVQNQGTLLTGGAALAPAQGIEVGGSACGAGTITVSGSLSLLSNTGQFVVGDAGVGSLVIADGGTVVTTPGSLAGLAGLAIAAAASASGSSVDVTGVQSQLDIAGALDVGFGGSGELQIGSGATVTADALAGGIAAGSVGRIGLTGSGSELSVAAAATVGVGGAATLSVLNGATLAAASLTLGALSGGSGTVEVSGTGSVIQLSGALNVGTAQGTGALTVGPGGAVHAAVVNLQGQVALQGGLFDPTILLVNPGVTLGGFGTIDASALIDEAVIQSNATSTGQREVVRGTVLGGGTLTCDGTVTTHAPGVLQINDGGTLELAGAVLNAATTSFADILNPAGNDTVNNSEVNVSFAGDTGELLLDDVAGFAGTIAAFHPGDDLVIAGGTLTGLQVSNGNTLMITDFGSGTGGLDQIIFGTPVTTAAFAIVNGDTVQAACFAAGTLIETAVGAIPVQDLAVGDEVHTLLGGPRQIVWVGSRVVECRRHLQPETVWPVRIERGAVAENVPQRDLFISPDHAVYLGGVLIPVKLLVNCSTIRQVPVDRIVYHHVELQQHDVVLAEGLAAETYLDVGDRHLFCGDMVAEPYPNFPTRWREMAGCAPLVLTGARLAAARLALGERARQRVVRAT